MWLILAPIFLRAPKLLKINVVSLNCSSLFNQALRSIHSLMHFTHKLYTLHTHCFLVKALLKDCR